MVLQADDLEIKADKMHGIDDRNFLIMNTKLIGLLDTLKLKVKGNPGELGRILAEGKR